MLTYNGKIIGIVNTPASKAVNSTAGGIWSLKDIEYYQRLSSWPIQPSPPSAPSVSISSVASNQVSVQLSSPISNGGIPITGYLLQVSNNTGLTWTSYGFFQNQNITVTGLINSTGYIFRSLALNEIGSGIFSSNSSLATPTAIATPSEPTNLAAFQGDASAFLTWSSPNSVGGALISDYIVQYSSDNGVSWITYQDTISTNTNSIVTNLINGISYIFRVAAINAGGQGPYSNNSNSIIPDTVPTISILTQPLNDRVTSHIEYGNFITSGIVSNGSAPNYQWQVYTDQNWINLPSNYNNPLINISYQDLYDQYLYPPYNGSGFMVRAILDYPGATSVTGRHAHLTNITYNHSIYMGLYSYDSSYIDYGYENNYTIYTYGTSIYDTSLYFVVEDYAEFYNYQNWYNGNTYLAKLQISNDSINWSDLTTQSGNGTIYQQINITPSNGETYYRYYVEDLWPYNVTDGSISRTESIFIYPVTPTKYRITWSE